MTVLLCITAAAAVLILGLLCFFGGFYIGGHKNLFVSARKPEENLSDEELLKIRRAERELYNFWNYNGEEQKDE